MSSALKGQSFASQRCNPSIPGQMQADMLGCSIFFLLCAAVRISVMPVLELAFFRLWPAPVAGLQCQDSFPVVASQQCQEGP